MDVRRENTDVRWVGFHQLQLGRPNAVLRWPRQEGVEWWNSVQIHKEKTLPFVNSNTAFWKIFTIVDSIQLNIRFTINLHICFNNLFKKFSLSISATREPLFKRKAQCG
jgi:hypothetical protein